jgi:hypothetical protein
MWPLGKGFILLSMKRTHIVFSIQVLMVKNQVFACTVFMIYAIVPLLSLFHDLYIYCYGSIETIMTKVHSNAEGEYFKTDNMAAVPKYIVLISIPSALKLLDMAYLFEIFEIKLSVKQTHHQQIALIPEYKSTPTCFGYCP